MLVRLVPGVHVNPDFIATVTARYSDLAFVIKLKDGREFTRYIDEERVDYLFDRMQRQFIKHGGVSPNDSKPLTPWTREEIFNSQVSQVIQYYNTGKPAQFWKPSVVGGL